MVSGLGEVLRRCLRCGWVGPLRDTTLAMAGALPIRRCPACAASAMIWEPTKAVGR